MTMSASAGSAVLEPERRDRHRERLRAATRRRTARGCWSRSCCGAQLAGVDDDVGPCADLGERLALGADAVEERLALLAQRMAAARLLEAADAASRRRPRGTARGSPCRARSSAVELAGQLVEELASAHVADDREAPDAAAGQLGEVDELADERRRQVVDAEVAEVLEGVDRLGAARAGHARDDHERGLLAFRRFDRELLVGHRSPPPASCRVVRVYRPTDPGVATLTTGSSRSRTRPMSRAGMLVERTHGVEEAQRTRDGTLDSRDHRPGRPLAVRQPRAVAAALPRARARGGGGRRATRCSSARKFLAIFSSNLSEFYMVRVAGLQAADRGRRQRALRRRADAAEQLAAVRARTARLLCAPRRSAFGGIRGGARRRGHPPPRLRRPDRGASARAPTRTSRRPCSRCSRRSPSTRAGRSRTSRT